MKRISPKVWIIIAALSLAAASKLFAAPPTGNASDVPAVVTIISNNPTPPSGMPGPDEADSTKAK